VRLSIEHISGSVYTPTQQRVTQEPSKVRAGKKNKKAKHLNGGVLWLFSFKADLRNQVDYITATKTSARSSSVLKEL